MLIGFSLINQPFLGSPNLGIPHMWATPTYGHWKQGKHQVGIKVLWWWEAQSKKKLSNIPSLFFLLAFSKSLPFLPAALKVGECEKFYSIVNFPVSRFFFGTSSSDSKNLNNSILTPWWQKKVSTACHTGTRPFFSLKCGSPAWALDGRILQQIYFRSACDCAEARRARHLQVVLRTPLNPLCNIDQAESSKDVHVATPSLINIGSLHHYQGTATRWGAWRFSWTCWFWGSADFLQSTTLIHRSSGVPVMGVARCRTPWPCEEIYGGWPDAFYFWAENLKGFEVIFQLTTWAAMTNSETLSSRLQTIQKQSTTNAALKSLSFLRPTLIEVPDPWQGCARVCHPK